MTPKCNTCENLVNGYAGFYCEGFDLMKLLPEKDFKPVTPNWCPKREKK